MNIFSYLLAIAAGVGNPVQAGANAQLNKSLASPIWSALFIYGVGIAGILSMLAIARHAWPGSQIPNVPWWAWTGGLLSIVSTMAGLTLAQKMGSGMFTGLSLTAAVLTSVALDHFGVLGFKQHPISSLRMAGYGLMIVGLWLVSRF